MFLLAAMVPRCFHMSSVPPTCCARELTRSFSHLDVAFEWYCEPSSITHIPYYVLQPDVRVNSHAIVNLEILTPIVNKQCLARYFVDVTTSFAF